MKYIKLYESFKETTQYLRVKDYLEYYSIENYTINDDLKVDVDGDVDLSDKRLEEIPVIFGKVTGAFNVSRNNLKSLEGSPYYVGSSFFCTSNELENLKGSPVEVVGSFFCNNNRLETLEGMPAEIGRNFDCSDNKTLKKLDSVSNIEGTIRCDIYADISAFDGYCKKIFMYPFHD